MNQYPLHERAAKVQDETQTIGLFMEWLLRRYTLALDTGRGRLVGVNMDINKLIAEFYGIDYKAYMAEKDAMLDEIRANA